MADTPAPDGLALPGRLTVADVVFEKIAISAALDVEGVVRQGSSMTGKIGNLVSRDTTTGTDYPRARVETVGGTAHVVDVAVALAWPTPIGRVCRQVRARVSDELARLTGDRPARVNVTVGEMVPGSSTRRTKRGFVEVPAVEEPVVEEPAVEEPAEREVSA